MFRLLSTIGLAALLGASALAYEPSDLSGQWVLNQNDGRGGAGCLLELTMTEVEGGALKLTRLNDGCPDVLGSATNWYMDGAQVILADDADKRLLIFDDQTQPEEVTMFGDTTGVYFLERM